MAAYDFPATDGQPTDGSFIYTAPTGVNYYWNGYAWIVESGGFAPLGDYVEKTGDTMTGALNVPAGASGTQVPQVQEVVQKTGDTMTGALNVPAGASGTEVPQVQEVVQKTGDKMTGALILDSIDDGLITIEAYGMPPHMFPGFRVKGERADAPGNDRQMEFALHADATDSILTPFMRLESTNGGASFFFRGNDGNFRIHNQLPKYNDGTVVGDQTSDERLKQNIVDYTSGLDVVLQLEPKQYEYIESPETRHAGFIAQQVQGLIPEAVYSTNELKGRDPNPYLAMSYVEIIPALVNSIKECNASIEALEAKVTSLEGGNN